MLAANVEILYLLPQKSFTSYVKERVYHDLLQLRFLNEGGFVTASGDF